MSNLATRKFAETINKFEENKFFAESAAVTDILEQQEEGDQNFEVELLNVPDPKKVPPGYKFKKNSEVDAKDRTFKNMY